MSSRVVIPNRFKYNATDSGAAVSAVNPAGHRLSVHPVSDGAVRVVHELPREKYPQKTNVGTQWEASDVKHEIQHNDCSIKLDLPGVQVDISLKGCPRLQWFAKDSDGAVQDTPFLADSHSRAYSYDAASGAVWHYVERENYLPVDEDEFTTVGEPFLHDERNEYVYGLGESRGTIEKSGRVFTMEGRDALSYCWENGDPLYKLQPFYTVYNKKTARWYGIFYNNVSDSRLDMGAEGDVLWGCFRSYRAACGPLDYYVIFGDGTLPSIVTQLGWLLSPSSNTSDGTIMRASPTLPPLSQFGYLSSSLALAAEPKAQESIIEFLKTSRKEGFPVDGLYLSSGWCQEEGTDNRHYFAWNTSRYPTPSDFGRIVEKELEVQVIVNVKPWLLDTHPMLESAEQVQAFVRAPDDALGDSERASEGGSKKDWVWSSGFAAHALGRYFDYSSIAGSQWWANAIKEQLIEKGLTGVWIDNNEMAGMVDGASTFRGEVGMWNARVPGLVDNVEKRMGWGSIVTRVGNVGKAINTIGMARATYEAVIGARPDDRPVIVSRSGLPGIQAYAHASWSGDNSTTWKALRWGTKMTLSVGLSFGPGLYGHDIGGFAGKHHPSPELLVRWCQNGAWHSRFTVHSWKEVSTTMWMYRDQPEIAEILRDVLQLRYRLAPTFYSLYVTDYQRRGWPLLKPLLWHHSIDPKTLKIDEDFLFGSHVLVASVVIKGATKRQVYLPGRSNDGEVGLQWCELDTGVWHDAGSDGKAIELDAPLSRTPVLVRAGGMLVLGGACSRNIYDGTTSRTILIFPAPAFSSSSDAGRRGSFRLVEDDFRSNDHTRRGTYTELELSFEIAQDGAIVVKSERLHDEWKLPYREIAWQLPAGDSREIRAEPNGSGREVQGEDGVRRFVLEI